MNKLWKYIQYGYLILAVILIVEGVMALNSNPKRAYFMFGFAIFSVLIFFFKRNFRRKIEKKHQQNQ